MTTRLIQIPADHIAALAAIRSVIADAASHPGRAAAIAALDYLASAPCDASCLCTPCCADRYRRLTVETPGDESPSDLRNRLHLPPPPYRTLSTASNGTALPIQYAPQAICNHQTYACRCFTF